MRENPIRPTVALDGDGVRHGYLKLPHSSDDSAWGAVMIPFTVIANGDGPTALVTGGNHGDEYEGPIALWSLAREIDATRIRGRVIMVPAMNYPAFRMGTRSSPIDGGNMNRSFPGRPDGGVTEKIADYFTRTLLPQSDLVLDIHSGGKTLEFVPFAGAHLLEDKAQEARSRAAMEAFAAPYSMMMLELDALDLYDTAAEAQGKTFVTTELGGGGSASAYTVAIARRGVRNVLVHAGILDADPEPAETIHLDTNDARCFVTSEHAGLLEPCVDLGEDVRAGDEIARVHDITRTGTAPVSYESPLDGILAGRHFPGLTRPGDTLAVIAI